MKVEFELNLDSDGRPCIKFKHYDKSASLEQKTLKVFIDAVKEKGMCLKNPSGYIDTNGNSWEKYEIQIGKKECEHEFISVPENRYSSNAVAQCQKCGYRP